MEVKCPHNILVKQRKELGINFYYHDDGKLCNLLNASNISLERLHKETLEAKQYELSHIYVMASMDTIVVENYFIDKLAELDYDDLIKTVKDYSSNALITTSLLTKLIEKYGEEIYLVFFSCDLMREHIYPQIHNSGYPEAVSRIFSHNGVRDSDILHKLLDNPKLKGLTGKNTADILGGGVSADTEVPY